MESCVRSADLLTDTLKMLVYIVTQKVPPGFIGEHITGIVPDVCRLHPLFQLVGAVLPKQLHDIRGGVYGPDLVVLRWREGVHMIDDLQLTVNQNASGFKVHPVPGQPPELA